MTVWVEHKRLDGLAAYREEKNQRRINGLAFLREFAEVAVLGFIGPFNAVVFTRAVACYLGGNVVLSDLLGTPFGFRVCAFPLKVPGGSAGPARVVALVEDEDEEEEEVLKDVDRPETGGPSAAS